MVYSTRRFVFGLALCYFVLAFFSPFSIAITSLGDERINLCAFHMFVRFALDWFCLFRLGVWKRLRFGLTRRGLTIGFHLLWLKVEKVMSTRFCLS